MVIRRGEASGVVLGMDDEGRSMENRDPSRTKLQWEVFLKWEVGRTDERWVGALPTSHARRHLGLFTPFFWKRWCVCGRDGLVSFGTERVGVRH